MAIRDERRSFPCIACGRVKPLNAKVRLDSCGHNACQHCMRKALQVEFWAMQRFREKDCRAACPVCSTAIEWLYADPPVYLPDAAQHYPLMLTPITYVGGKIVLFCNGKPVGSEAHRIDAQKAGNDAPPVEATFAILEEGTLTGHRSLTPEEQQIVVERVREAYRVVAVFFPHGVPESAIFGTPSAIASTTRLAVARLEKEVENRQIACGSRWRNGSRPPRREDATSSRGSFEEAMSRPRKQPSEWQQKQPSEWPLQPGDSSSWGERHEDDWRQQSTTFLVHRPPETPRSKEMTGRGEEERGGVPLGGHRASRFSSALPSSLKVPPPPPPAEPRDGGHAATPFARPWRPVPPPPTALPMTRGSSAIALLAAGAHANSAQRYPNVAPKPAVVFPNVRDGVSNGGDSVTPASRDACIQSTAGCAPNARICTSRAEHCCRDVRDRHVRDPVPKVKRSTSSTRKEYVPSASGAFTADPPFWRGAGARTPPPRSPLPRTPPPSPGPLPHQANDGSLDHQDVRLREEEVAPQREFDEQPPGGKSRKGRMTCVVQALVSMGQALQTRHWGAPPRPSLPTLDKPPCESFARDRFFDRPSPGIPQGAFESPDFQQHTAFEQESLFEGTSTPARLLNELATGLSHPTEGMMGEPQRTLDLGHLHEQRIPPLDHLTAQRGVVWQHGPPLTLDGGAEDCPPMDAIQRLLARHAQGGSKAALADERSSTSKIDELPNSDENGAHTSLLTLAAKMAQSREMEPYDPFRSTNGWRGTATRSLWWRCWGGPSENVWSADAMLSDLIGRFSASGGGRPRQPPPVCRANPGDRFDSPGRHTSNPAAQQMIGKSAHRTSNGSQHRGQPLHGGRPVVGQTPLEHPPLEQPFIESLSAGAQPAADRHGVVDPTVSRRPLRHINTEIKKYNRQAVENQREDWPRMEPGTVIPSSRGDTRRDMTPFLATSYEKGLGLPGSLEGSSQLSTNCCPTPQENGSPKRRLSPRRYWEFDSPLDSLEGFPVANPHGFFAAFL